MPAGHSIHKSVHCDWLAWLQRVIWLPTFWLRCSKGNLTLPLVYLSQKWVSAGINIHYKPNDEISVNIFLLTVPLSLGELLQNIHSPYGCQILYMSKCINVMEAADVKLNRAALSNLKDNTQGLCLCVRVDEDVCELFVRTNQAFYSV